MFHWFIGSLVIRFYIMMMFSFQYLCMLLYQRRKKESNITIYTFCRMIMIFTVIRIYNDKIKSFLAYGNLKIMKS